MARETEDYLHFMCPAIFRGTKKKRRTNALGQVVLATDGADYSLADRGYLGAGGTEYPL